MQTRSNSRSVVSDSFVTPWTVGRQAPLSMGFSRQEYWSGLPFPPPGDLPSPGIERRSPALQADSTVWATREAYRYMDYYQKIKEDTVYSCISINWVVCRKVTFFQNWLQCDRKASSNQKWQGRKTLSKIYPKKSIKPIGYVLILIYFWLCWIFIAVRGLSLAVASRGYSLVVFRLLSAVASLLQSTGSWWVRFSSCGPWV